MTRRWKGRSIVPLLVPAAALLALVNCDDGGGTGTRVPTSITIAPQLAATGPDGTAAFTATDDLGASADVTWGVNGVDGGSATLGRISAAGVYTAPALPPDADSVVVSAVAVANGALQAEASVFLLPDNATTDYYVQLPRVVDATHPTATRVLIVGPPGTASISFAPFVGAPRSLTGLGSGVFTFTLDAAETLTGYVTNTLHHLVGRLDYRLGNGTSIKLTQMSVNVRDAGMPDVPVTALAADAQRTPHVLNLRVDTAVTEASPEIAARALQLLGGDRFEFLIIVANVQSNRNRHYIALRNDIAGIGSPIMDQSAPWGGAGRLRGVAVFPLDGFFDGAQHGTIHEIGHSWINFATDPVLAPGVPHWPLSTMARGVMGMSIPGSGAGGEFPWTLSDAGNAQALVRAAEPTDHFTPLDLYVMGLLPSDSVPSMIVLAPTVDPSTLADGLVVPATTYTIGDYVAQMGARVPSSTTAPRQFSAACVVLSAARLLTATEMAFFDTACARADTRVPLPYSVGFANGMASGFFLATGGRATLTTQLP